ncbi:16S rRNA (uracil(1498)-N(3))-methyltransferase [Ornithinibacillus sp. L9]|uniref:Ribosomal RNA small subunit methyltransferase E n=1 Tax=Ornithinibacillus caprae TaxID=2678566 RepID=A0A6N8FD38_9BACI|nr:16S rRNA (uracil(1498)-N(3))-methyltransferase [Ornithinibacillus caprae]MUK87081.1 16S rRNA (uracil(1498)-N(3))-methyltransferase [Ornithinibacillus caprae]
MQRYFIPAEGWQDQYVTISGDDAHHIIRVMRYQKDDQIICNHPDTNAAICRITEIEDGVVYLVIEKWLDENVELPVQVTIAQGLPKGDKLDLVLQKGTELGAYGFIPFKADRSVVKWDNKKEKKKQERFTKIVKEASEQSHRNRIPVVYNPMNLTELIEESAHYSVKIFAYEEEAKVSEYLSFSKIVSQLSKKDRVLVCIGPEGGFSLDEVEKLKTHGFMAVRLGPRILRTETAPLYVLASISYHTEELGC